MKLNLTKIEATKRLTHLRQAIDSYRYEYHVLDRQSISDAALDSLKHELTQLEMQYPELITADSPSQRIAGKPLPGFTKVKHTERMFSLADVFSVDELRAWDARWKKLRPQATTAYLADLKLDGLAVTLQYTNGLLTRAATRGDGFIGEDVTQNVKTIEAVPLRLRLDDISAKLRRQIETSTIEIRGEIVMLKKDFITLNKQQVKLGLPVFANPRNVSAGSIRQLDPQMAAGRKLSFFAWELLSDLGQGAISASYALLKQLGIPVNPKATPCRSLDEVIDVHQQIFAQREDLPFWIDGVVIKLNDRALYQELGYVGKTPRAAVAWKFAAEQVTTIIEDIILQVGRTGALTPVAHLQPVEVAGTTVSRATLHNADEIQRLDVRVGDTVVIQKAGDIIPEVVQVVMPLRPKKSSAWKMAKVCPVCRQPVQRNEGEVIHYCVNRNCPARQREHLYHFVSRRAFDIDGLGPSTIDTLVDENLVHEPADFYRLKKEQLIGLPLFAEKKAENLIVAIHQRQKISFDRFIFSLGIRHVGEETARTLAREFTTVQRLVSASAEQLQTVGDVGTVVAKSISQFFADRHHRESVQRLASHLQFITSERSVTSGLNGKTFVVTGVLETMSRDEAHEAIRRAGGKVTSSVSAKTSYVVVGAEPGSKAVKATQLGVNMLTEQDFIKLLKK